MTITKTNITKPKILFYDIETMAAKVYTWSQYQTNVIATDEDWYLLSVAWKWEGEKEVNFARKSKKKRDDKGLAGIIWNLLDKADIVVAHNGDSFDQKMVTARFIELGMTPPSPYQSVDTKKVMASAARNYSNKLDEIARRFAIGRKLNTLGFNTWIGCAEENANSWELMEKYNRHDVILLEKVYYKLQPWTDSVNMAHWTNGELACKRCGSTNVQKRGVRRTNASVFQAYQCNICGGWSRAVKSEKIKPGVR